MHSKQAIRTFLPLRGVLLTKKYKSVGMCFCLTIWTCAGSIDCWEKCFAGLNPVDAWSISSLEEKDKASSWPLNCRIQLFFFFLCSDFEQKLPYWIFKYSKKMSWCFLMHWGSETARGVLWHKDAQVCVVSGAKEAKLKKCVLCWTVLAGFGSKPKYLT